MQVENLFSKNSKLLRHDKLKNIEGFKKDNNNYVIKSYTLLQVSKGWKLKQNSWKQKYEHQCTLKKIVKKFATGVWPSNPFPGYS